MEEPRFSNFYTGREFTTWKGRISSNESVSQYQIETMHSREQDLTVKSSKANMQIANT